MACSVTSTSSGTDTAIQSSRCSPKCNVITSVAISILTVGVLIAVAGAIVFSGGLLAAGAAIVVCGAVLWGVSCCRGRVYVSSNSYSSSFPTYGVSARTAHHNTGAVYLPTRPAHGGYPAPSSTAVGGQGNPLRPPAASMPARMGSYDRGNARGGAVVVETR